MGWALHSHSSPSSCGAIGRQKHTLKIFSKEEFIEKILYSLRRHFHDNFIPFQQLFLHSAQYFKLIRIYYNYVSLAWKFLYDCRCMKLIYLSSSSLYTEYKSPNFYNLLEHIITFWFSFRISPRVRGLFSSELLILFPGHLQGRFHPRWHVSDTTNRRIKKKVYHKSAKSNWMKKICW